MSEVTHTPGPWKVVSYCWSDCGIYAAEDKFFGCSLSIKDEATEENQDALESEMDANARLIAAAPEMLESLENIIELAPKESECECHRKPVAQLECPTCMMTDFFISLGDVKAVIAKATGQEVSS